MSPEKFSFKARSDSFKHAFRGMWSMLKSEHNARIHLLASILALLAAIIFKINLVEWSLLIIVIGLVFAAELVNTGIETMADIVKPEYDENIKKVKDYTAAAVLITALVAIICGGIIFIPKILKLILNGF